MTSGPMGPPNGSGKLPSHDVGMVGRVHNRFLFIERQSPGDKPPPAPVVGSLDPSGDRYPDFPPGGESGLGR